MELDDVDLYDGLSDFEITELIESPNGPMRPRASSVRRVYSLVLFFALESLGAAPISRSKVPHLLYLVDCLLPALKVDTLEGMVLKSEQGPYLADWFWDVDRLIGMGLLEIVSLERDVSRKDNLLGLSEVGLDVVRALLADMPGMQKVIQAFKELAQVFVDVTGSKSGREVVEDDLCYADPTISVGDIVDYGVWEDQNLSVDQIKVIGQRLAVSEEARPRLATQVYLQILATPKEVHLGGAL